MSKSCIKNAASPRRLRFFQKSTTEPRVPLQKDLNLLNIHQCTDGVELSKLGKSLPLEDPSQHTHLGMTQVTNHMTSSLVQTL